MITHEPSKSSKNTEKAKKTSITIADINNNNNNNDDDNINKDDNGNNGTFNDSEIGITRNTNDTLNLKGRKILKLLKEEEEEEEEEEEKNLLSFPPSSPSFSWISSGKNETSLSKDGKDKIEDKVEKGKKDKETTGLFIDTSSLLPKQQHRQQPSSQSSSLSSSPALSPSSSLLSLSSSPSSPTIINNNYHENLPNAKKVPRRNRSVSFSKTVTFVPHVPTPPTKIRKKLSKEATVNHKDVIVEVEDLGKVRMNGKNGRVMKIIPFVWPGPLNCDDMNDDDDNGDNDDIIMNNYQSPRSSTSYDDDDEYDDDDVVVITAVPITEKEKKSSIGKYFKRYYNKLVPQHLLHLDHHHHQQQQEGDEEEKEQQEQEQEV